MITLDQFPEDFPLIIDSKIKKKQDEINEVRRLPKHFVNCWGDFIEYCAYYDNPNICKHVCNYSKKRKEDGL